MQLGATFNVSNAMYAGGMVGYSKSGRYESCSINLSINATGVKYVGALMAYSYEDFYIDSCMIQPSSTGILIEYTITDNESASYIGGWAGEIVNSYNTVSGGSPLPESRVNTTGTINVINNVDNYNNSIYAGGVVGNNNSSHLKDLSSYCSEVQ